MNRKEINNDNFLPIIKLLKQCVRIQEHVGKHVKIHEYLDNLCSDALKSVDIALEQTYFYEKNLMSLTVDKNPA